MSLADATLKPLAGKTGDDGRLMAADFVSAFNALTSDLQALWDHIKVNLTSFTYPSV